MIAATSTAAACLAVALGGAAGSMARFLVSRWALATFGPGFPVGTLAVNVVGSLAMGAAAALLLERAPAARLAPFVMAGLLGGFTTFSAFALDTIFLIERGEAAKAALYAGGSVALSLAALWAGLALGRAV